MSEKTESNFRVKEVAALAHLCLPDFMVERLQKEMTQIVGYVELLNELDVVDIEPTAHAVARVNVLREDVATQPFSREKMLKNAPATIHEELIKVPQVLPGEGTAS